MNKFIEGGAAEIPLVTTLGPKLEALDGLDETTAGQLVDEAAQLVATEVIPGYQAMISLFESMLPEATHDAGIWRLPDGDAIYATKLQSNTTTQYSPDEIHALGSSHRIEGEMLDILDPASPAVRATNSWKTRAPISTRPCRYDRLSGGF